MPETIAVPAPAANRHGSHPEPAVEVFAVFGAEPEVQAYAMAKYSRSALSMKESLREISIQKAEKFLNTFYFQYGHRSIADLAHIALAVEKLSILAAIALADETRWDGQERSTRYQDFRKGGYYTPDFGETNVGAGDSPSTEQSDRGHVGAGDSPAQGSPAVLYRETVDFLFAEYEALSEHIFQHLVSITPKPADMKQEAYERTLRARAFDVTRYLLPLATNTSLGEIVNARTLETQVAHLLSHTHAEVRHLAELLKKAACEPAWNVNEDSLRALVEDIRRADPALGERAAEELLKEVRVAPTLVKYANANPYEIETRQTLRQAAAELMKGAPITASPLVDLLDDDAVEIELASTLLYEHCHYPYRQIRDALQAAGEKRRDEIIELGTRHRGKHDELLRAFSVGQQFRFDILMDIGGFRDMHRHRRCVQILQGFTTTHGYDTPPEIAAAGLRDRYDRTMQKTAAAISTLSKSSTPEAAESSQYAIPLAFRTRALFKMDFAEALYISELRTTPAGHASYRNVAYAMYEAVARRHPALAKYFRVHDVRQPVDLLKR
jgi:thymidylate synthase ThyX